MKNWTIKLLTLVVFCFIQTTSSAQILPALIETFNELCPVDIGSGCSIKSLTVNQKNVEMTFIFNEKIISIQDLEESKDTYANTLSRSFAEDPSSKILIEQIAKEGYGLMLIVIGDTSGEQCEIFISNQKLKEALTATDEDIEEDQILLGVTNSKHQLPLKRGEVTLEDIVLSDNTVMFIYNAPDEMMKPAVLKSGDTLTSVINEEFEFALSNYFEKKLFNDIIDKGIQTTFRFEYNKKKKHKDVTLSAQEIANGIANAGKQHEQELEVYVSLMKLGLSEGQDVVIDGDNIIVSLTVDKTMIDLLSLQADDQNQLYANADLVKQSVSNSKNIAFVFKAIAASNKNLIYHYLNSENDNSVKCVIKNISLVQALMDY